MLQIPSLSILMPCGFPDKDEDNRLKTNTEYADFVESEMITALLFDGDIPMVTAQESRCKSQRDRSHPDFVGLWLRTE